MKNKILEIVSKGYSLTKQRVARVKRKYLGLYTSKLLELYDLGYSSEPNVLDEASILSSYSDVGVNLSFLDGEIKLEPWVFFLEGFMAKNRGDSESYKFYKLIEDLLNFRNIWSNLDSFYEMLGGTSMVVKRKYKLKHGFGTTFYNEIGLPNVSKEFFEVFIEGDEYIERVPYYTGYFEKLKKFYKAGKDSLIDGISDENLQSYFKQIALGGIKTNLVCSYDDAFITLNSIDLVSDRKKDLEDIEAHYNDYIESNKDAKLISIDYYSFYFVRKRQENFKEVIPIGSYCIDYDTGKILPSVNSVLGVTGDFVSIDSPTLSESGIFPVGSPIELVGLDGQFSYYYSTENILGLGDSSLLLDLGYTLSIEDIADYVPPKPEELGLVDYYLNNMELQEYGVFSRELSGGYSEESKLSAIRKVINLNETKG